jgi:hypothetical protein
LTSELVNLSSLQHAIRPMLHSTLYNYIVPGLTSHLVGGSDAHGRVRLFDAQRETLEFITPHSHRFNFTCLVLEGRAHNTLFIKTHTDSNSEPWVVSTIDQVCGANGIREYVHVRDTEPTYWTHATFTYDVGETYSMSFKEIHSIKFERGSMVLFFEGPQLVTTSQMIEPWANDKVVPTFRTEPWMFERAQ